MARQHPSNPEGRKLNPTDRPSVSCSKQECQKCLLGLLQTCGKLMNIKGCEPTASSLVQKTRRAAIGGNGKRREKTEKDTRSKEATNGTNISSSTCQRLLPTVIY